MGGGAVPPLLGNDENSVSNALRGSAIAPTGSSLPANNNWYSPTPTLEVCRLTLWYRLFWPMRCARERLASQQRAAGFVVAVATHDRRDFVVEARDHRETRLVRRERHQERTELEARARARRRPQGVHRALAVHHDHEARGRCVLRARAARREAFEKR
jgi:hypothetical protein